MTPPYSNNCPISTNHHIFLSLCQLYKKLTFLGHTFFYSKKFSKFLMVFIQERLHCMQVLPVCVKQKPFLYKVYYLNFTCTYVFQIYFNLSKYLPKHQYSKNLRKVISEYWQLFCNIFTKIYDKTSSAVLLHQKTSPNSFQF